MNKSKKDLVKPLNITYVNEAGVDEGGLTKDWFLQLTKELFNPGKCLFQPTFKNGNLVIPNPSSSI